MQIPKCEYEKAIDLESGTLTSQSQQEAVLNEVYKYKGVHYTGDGNASTASSGYVK